MITYIIRITIIYTQLKHHFEKKNIVLADELKNKLSGQNNGRWVVGTDLRKDGLTWVKLYVNRIKVSCERIARNTCLRELRKKEGKKPILEANTERM